MEWVPYVVLPFLAGFGSYLGTRARVATELAWLKRETERIDGRVGKVNTRLDRHIEADSRRG